jgi:leader peptidase (prepilin peptidase)/N-methyltransferase
MLGGMNLLAPTLIALLCAAYGSFAANHLDRWPPRWGARSRCGHCQRTLSPLELIPIISYFALRGRCRHCRTPISRWVPQVEASFLLLVPLATVAPPLGLVAWGMLLHGAWIDIRRLVIPDGLTLPALGLALAAGAGSDPVLLRRAANGASFAAGASVLVAGLGGWAVRGGRDRRERLSPLSFDSVWIAALVGLLAGVEAGLGAAAGHALLCATTGRPWHPPEPPLLGAWLLGALWLIGGGAPAGVAASLHAAGGVALAAGLYWWWAAPRGAASENASDQEALGFGDVKLAGALGALLGPAAAALALALAVALGAAVGLLFWRSGRRALPFGPFLWLAGWLSALYAAPIGRAAERLLGLC